MNFKIFGAFVGLLLSMSATTALALTVEQPVTPATVQERPDEFGVKATQGKDGLIHFTIRRTLKEPMYLVAHLAVRHLGKVIVTSDTPSFAVKGQNTFYFSISLENVADSEFMLGESGISKTGVPVVGTMHYKFRLSDFVPADSLRR
jgi:hypothetical protein